MKKILKYFVVGVIILTLLAGTAIGETITKTIEVVYNTVNITVNGTKIEADNILYNGTTYVPLRAVAEVLDKEVGWDQNTLTASINDKKATVGGKLNGFKQYLKDNGFTVGDNEIVAYDMLYAKDGLKFKINNELIEIYEYDTANLSADASSIVDQAKQGSVNFLGFNMPVTYNNGLMLVRYDDHSQGDKIVELFNSYKITIQSK